VTYGNDVHALSRVVHRINHAIITNPNPPEVLRAFEVFATGRAGLRGQGLDLGENPLDQLSRQMLQFFARQFG
jgi:hypothetical protein